MFRIFWRWKIWYFWAKKLMEIWYLLITEKFLFSSFREWNIRSFSAKKLTERWYLLITEKVLFELLGDGKYGIFLSQKVNRKMMFTGYWKAYVLNFSVMGNVVFFSAKKLMEIWYLLGLFELSVIYQDLGNMILRAVLRQ